MTEEATQQGVSKRDQDYNDLVARRSEETEAEAASRDVEDLSMAAEGEENENIEGDTPVKEGAPKQEMVTVQGSDGQLYEVPKDGKVKLKVDGEEVESSFDNITRNYQKGAAGDKRLQEANAKLQEIDQKTENLTKREAKFQKDMKEAQAKEADGSLSSDDYKDTVKNLAAALIDADLGTAIELLGKVVPGQQAASTVISDEDLNQRLESKLSERDKAKAEAEFEKLRLEGVKAFKSDFPEIAEDDDLTNLVGSRTERIFFEDPTADPRDIIKQAATEVQEKFGKAKRKVAPKKQTPTAAGGRAVIGTDAKPDKTREEVLADMRRARSQP